MAINLNNVYVIKVNDGINANNNININPLPGYYNCQSVLLPIAHYQ
jgi:hypothetical protein